jgi:23S rRNA (adenine2503-C2)-methyltransferase
MKTLHDPTREELSTLLDGEPSYRLDQLWSGLYTQFLEPGGITTLPAALRARISESLPAALVEIARSVTDDGDTVKYLWNLADGGHPIETVLMYYDDRATVCVSTQAGCAMACGFCATGQAGFNRHLTVGEIVEQVVRAARDARARDRRVDNIVFMGMGEPLANEAVVWSSIERIHDDIGISARHLTVSTVGIVPGIRTLATRPLPVNLAVSLHAARNDLRNSLVPINVRYPIEVLMDACREYLAAKRRRITFEWALIDGVNDTSRDADELAVLCRALSPSAHVNLIPLNPTPGWPTRGTSAAQVQRFRSWLETHGVNATIRRNRGTDIDAACGQLAAGQPVTIGIQRR